MRLIEKLGLIEDPGDSLDAQVSYLQLQRQVVVLQAQIEMLEKGEVLLTSAGPPDQTGRLQIQEFSFVDGVARLANGTEVRGARLVYEIDLQEYSDITMLDEQIGNLRRGSAMEACYAFNSLPDGERKERHAIYVTLRTEFMSIQKRIQTLDRSASGFEADYSALASRSRDIWRSMLDVVPPAVFIHPRTLLASPRW